MANSVAPIIGSNGDVHAKVGAYEVSCAVGAGLSLELALFALLRGSCPAPLSSPLLLSPHPLTDQLRIIMSVLLRVSHCLGTMASTYLKIQL